MIFPNESEPDLSTLFQATLRSSASVLNVINTLQLDEEVEYAHEPAERRPE